MSRLPALPASVPLALLTRGAEPESVHRGAVAVVDAEGRLLAACGDPCWPVWLRSAAKPFQLVPFLASPGVSALRLSAREVAVAAASHGGEGLHVKTVESLLSRGGFSERDLNCGGHLPMDEASARELVRSGREPGPLHNNCSGKHAAMLLACRLRGEDPRRYESPSHPHQRRILSYLSRATGTPERSIGVGVDGCASPVFRLPLTALARGYARAADRAGADDGRPFRQLTET